MRHWTIAYALIATWTFGWLAGRFGMLPSLFAAVVIFAPVFFAWRMAAPNKVTKRREYVYLALVTSMAICGTGFVVAKWHETGMDRSAMFDREFYKFKNRVASMPEYENVEVSFTHRKGGRVYLHGHVTNKESHDRLLQTYEWMVRNNESGCYDGVDYPGKSAEGETRPKN
ncbi:MAG: hypothetical protein Q8M16_00290 [Pirellulaceae bacterium]|nr:hypothetical protein [Pirellulaceae bacterium]